MTKTRATVLVLLSFCSALALVWGFIFERSARGRIADFKLAYYDTQCLLHHCDPYSKGEMWRVFVEEGGVVPADPVQQEQIIRRMPQQVYLPTAFPFIAPFALLRWEVAHLLWMVLTAGTLTLAAFLVLNEAWPRAPSIAFYFICFILVNSGIVIAGGNSAGIVVGLSTLAAWCLIHERFEVPGVACLAVSLAIKPHDAGWVWLFLFLAGGVLRKRALQAVIVLAAIAVPALIWVTYAVPHWIQEMQANLQMTSALGGNADPGPASGVGLGPGMIIDLQTALSLLLDEPRFYNLTTYFICVPLFLVWVIVTLRARFSIARAWIALAAIAPLSMLPVYHRPYDAKLLMLTIPACATLWAEGGVVGWSAVLLTGAGLVATSDIPLAIGNLLTAGLNSSPVGSLQKIKAVLLMRPAPLVLLALGTFYLWIYVRRSRSDGNEGTEATQSIPECKETAADAEVTSSRGQAVSEGIRLM